MTMEFKELFDQGKRHLEGKNYLRAEQSFQKILRSGKRYADVLNMLGVVYHVEGKFNNAIESFEEALRINPHYTEASLNLAVLFNDLGEYKKAKNLYVRIQKRRSPAGLDPMTRGKIANLHARLGDTYRELGRHEEAIGEYTKALGLCPAFVDIRTKLGIAYRENNQKELSEKELRAAASQNSLFKEALLQLGVTYYAMGRKEKAAEVWQKLLQKDKDHEIARMYLRLCENGERSARKK